MPRELLPSPAGWCLLVLSRASYGVPQVLLHRAAAAASWLGGQDGRIRHGCGWSRAEEGRFREGTGSAPERRQKREVPKPSAVEKNQVARLEAADCMKVQCNCFSPLA